MTISVVRLGQPRLTGEGPRLGTVRRPPRGVRKTDFARLNYYDTWVPELAPSAQLVSWALANQWTDERWNRYERAYLREMKQKPAERLIGLLATLSHSADFSVGCYCEDERRCHRSLLRRLLEQEGATLK